jgi:predicted dienelactone hydrolase
MCVFTAKYLSAVARQSEGARVFVSKLRLVQLNTLNVLLLAGLALYLMAMSTQAAGFESIEVPAGADSPALVAAMWYPCSQPPDEIDLGPLKVRGIKGCAIRGNELPLIVISHGNLGAFFDHHDTAEALADAGFIVAAITHRGDNTPNFSDGADPSVMIGRSADIKRLIDFMLVGSPAAGNIDPKRVGFFGFSAGAYTGLVLTGAEPEWAVVMCRFSSAPRACVRILENELAARPRASEPRIKAAVLADPPGIWLAPDGFASVTVPIQLWASETGGRGLPNVLVKPEDVAAIEKNLPGKHEYHVVPKAGHFAFMLCGPSIKAIPEFCVDPPGFDRVAFHKQFNADMVRFFRAQLGAQ